MDLAKKPEWYHRPQVGCGPESGSPFRCRSSSSYGSLSTRLLPEQAPVHCRNMDQHLYRSRVQGSRWHQGCYGPSRTGSPVPESSGGDESDSDSDVIFLVSSTEEPLLCSPFIQDGVGPAASPAASPVASSVASPAASSLDDGPGCYRPLPLSSASPDSSYSDESSDSSVDVLLHRARPVVLLSELGAVYETRPDFSVDISSDDSDVIEVSLAPDKLRGAAPRSDEEEAPPTAVRRSSRIRRSASETPPFVRRTSRNRLERRAKNDAVGIYYESCESDDVVEGESRLSGSDDPAAQLRMLGGASRNRGDESGVHVETDRKLPQTASEPWREGSEPVSCGQNQQEEGGKAGADQKRKGAAPERRRSKPSANRKPTARWRRKRRLQVGPSAGFCPREPEIKLRYAEVKEEKKRKAGGFCPFVHVDKTACVIVNFQEDQESVRSSPGRRRPVPHSVPGFVPNTSCFQLCRFSSDGECQAALLCCLCGQTANAMGLGDLHGPYRPSGPSGNQQNRWTDGAAGCNHSVVESPTRGDCSSLPKAPPECWIHEDCGIWAAGVFLVRGRLYGLEEAARLARETVCSVCQQTGAIMGCFLKSCSKGFHYRCAIQSGCVLNEDNFSVRCSEHKVTMGCNGPRVL
ncbi:uncharacterized protein LOC130515526 isoform X1 [Takifugu flavidus]|uniref:uncharacterized protein LOC130515526 isoform X1 n=1 Tax=Takifugu flavidus TaxID=433684 RepID=UPI00254430D0|nr:uncharacterized protein LOC130515526 isoform X1 [Takifugu flavidus]XP_056871825.1 uncharacterized protein LOC130515526 isoform X1 [Takifugu flavidus]XP_056871827.1 uncharacterized protein LOC130515526 isoform X1 [Takifugu flavidus]XP_056871828.1 uncharacterized protein LOC130515526 isoform X1 [Takifugu flavidus]XP_056871829.1 uncharacterized protein LOC130515526 isoform X1 [Takifugu flavidus]XP_056871830.1 uncharacterized protein LOC130515526 isoform X1 [Takifugu flavidus]